MCTMTVTTVTSRMDEDAILPALPSSFQKRSPVKSDDFFSATCVLFSSVCGASTVAIDNKIEQAMDLVKSHLMYAVREEVEVLKEQIKELLEKNSQLEYENSVLRNEAKPETLAKLSANNAKPPTSSS